MDQYQSSSRDGLDSVIKILTIIKLLIEVALWGLALGFTIWLMMSNPLPKLMQSFQASITKSMTGGLGH